MARNYEIEELYEEQLRAFKMWMQLAGYTGTTQKEYMREATDYLKSLNGLSPAEASKLNVIELLFSKRNASDLAKNRTLSAVRTFYKALVDFEMSSRNPAAEVKKAKTEKNKKPVYLEESELIESLQYINGRYRNRNIAIFLLMGYCGLRVGEVHRLNLNNFKKEKGTIEVLGKGRKWNEIPVPELLVKYLSEVEQERINPHSKKEDAFFISQKGMRLSIRQIQKVASLTFKAFKESNPNLSDMKLSCHKLRHSFATMMLKNGVDIRVVKELLGHASIETTMIYTHVNDEQKKQAMSTVKIPVSIVS